MKNVFIIAVIAMVISVSGFAKTQVPAQQLAVGGAYTTGEDDLSQINVSLEYGISDFFDAGIGYRSSNQDDGTSIDITAFTAGINGYYPIHNFVLSAGFAYGTGSADPSGQSSLDFTATNILARVFYVTEFNLQPFISHVWATTDLEGQSEDSDTTFNLGVVYDVKDNIDVTFLVNTEDSAYTLSARYFFSL